ncbi:virulence factor BrkB family protein [Aliidiomarina sp. Khilg15.8]
MIDWPKRRKQTLKGAHVFGMHGLDFVKLFVKRCINDGVTITAGHLTYVTLLSLVPLIAVIFAMLATFPMFEDMRAAFQDNMLNNLMPASGDALQEYLNQFVENARELSAIGVAFLFVVAIMLMSVIDKSLNRIWRIQKKRRFSISLAVYWMVLTMGPALVGISIGASSYLLSLTAAADAYVSGLNAFMLTLFPVLATTVAFLLLYVLVPNKVVKARHAIWGAIFAAVLFELAKNGFALYLNYFPAYQVIYGAVATVPILIVWIYVSWNIILLGAEVTASVEDYVGADEELSAKEKQDPDTDHESKVED